LSSAPLAVPGVEVRMEAWWKPLAGIGLREVAGLPIHESKSFESVLASILGIIHLRSGHGSDARGRIGGNATTALSIVAIAVIAETSLTRATTAGRMRRFARPLARCERVAIRFAWPFRRYDRSRVVRALQLRKGAIAGWMALGLFVAVAATNPASARRATVHVDRVGGALAVPNGDLVAITVRGRVLVLTQGGREVRALPGRIGPNGLAESIQLAPDRRHAWVSVWNVATESFRMYSVDLTTGRRRRLADGVGPSLSPNRTELAYIGFSRFPRGEQAETRLVIEDLHDGRSRSIPFGSLTVPGNPPNLVVSWSPDGSQIAVEPAGRYRLVNLRTARTVDSARSLPGPLVAPAYLSDDTIVADANCCVGSQRLVKLDVRTGREWKFATLSSPVQTIQRMALGTLLVTDALNELLRVSQHRVQRLRDGIEAASL
jgi:hypothetical protein